MRKKPLTYYQKQNLKQPLLKIGSKVENLVYTDKNIDPNLNYFNKYLNQEEQNKLTKMQKERAELGYLAKTYEESHMENPNLVKKKIDVDKISGKIGQENKEDNYNKYINQKTQIYNSTLSTEPLSKPNIRSINYHGYNIINNMILGFCDPGQKFPKTSYQNNYEGKQLPKEVENLSPEEYQDYMKFRNEQLNLMMNKEREMKGSLGNNMKEIVRKKNLTEDEKKRLILQQKMLREQEYQKNVQLLAQEQRNMDKAQINLSTKKDLQAETQRQYDLYMQQQQLMEQKEKEKIPMMPPKNEEEEQYLKMKKEQEEYERYQQAMMAQQQQPPLSPEEIEYYRQIQQQREYERYMYEQEMMRKQQEAYLEQQAGKNQPINKNPNIEIKEPSVNKNIEEKNLPQKDPQQLSQEEEAYRKKYEEYLLQQEQLNNQNKIPNQQLPPENKLSDKDYMNYLNNMRNQEIQQEQQILTPNNTNPQYPTNNVPYKEILPENSQIPIKQKTPADIEREKRMQQLYLEQQQRQQEELLMQQQMKNLQSEEEYMKKIKNYEDIIQNQPMINQDTHEESLMVDPALRQKQIEHMNQLNMQYQGAEVGQINPKNFVSNNPYSDKNYTLGNSNLQQNPIIHPINSYKFDYNRLYNPLSFKRQESGKRLQGYGNNIINK